MICKIQTARRLTTKLNRSERGLLSEEVGKVGDFLKP